jgi:hypothetical protein
MGTFNNFMNKKHCENILKTLKRTKEKHSPCNLQCIYNVFDQKLFNVPSVFG